jgi:hypothetical protein
MHPILNPRAGSEPVRSDPPSRGESSWGGPVIAAQMNQGLFKQLVRVLHFTQANQNPKTKTIIARYAPGINNQHGQSFFISKDPPDHRQLSSFVCRPADITAQSQRTCFHWSLAAATSRLLRCSTTSKPQERFKGPAH